MIAFGANARIMGNQFGTRYCGITMLIWINLAIIILGGAAFLQSRRVRSQVRGLTSQLGRSEAVLRPDLPEEVRNFAIRCGATGDKRLVRYSQSTEMELKPGAGWQAYAASQWVDVSEAGFVWLARQMRWGVVTVQVIDTYVRGQGLLIAWLLGLVPVARAEGADMNRAEAMRYLAELPWAPDAILSNPSLRWTVLGADRWQVALGEAQVTFILNADGDIQEVYANDRPSLEGGKTVLREWRGIFGDYGWIAGRRIPLTAEVGYIMDGSYAPYFRGRVTDYALR